MNRTIRPIKIVEVSARDGLQNEKQMISAATKIELVNRLSQAGIVNVEAASFVSPKWVPQMADGAAVMQGINRRAGTIYSVLTPNMQGLQAALAASADEVVIFGAASEAFSQKNINCSIAESLARFEPVAKAALAAGVRLRGSISCTMGCPYQGEVSTEQVVEVVMRLAQLGCHEIDIADTIGVGTAGQVQDVMSACAKAYPMAQLSGHFHDTYGQALANIYAAAEMGISIFHSSVAGIGGCPYAKGATGNVATEDVLYMLHGLGYSTGIDLDQMVLTGDWISQQLGKANASRVGRARLSKMATSV